MKKKVILWSFSVTMILFLIVAMLRGLYPFGEKSLLVFDMSQQYVEFFGYLKHVFLGQVDWNYSFVQSLGGDSVGLFAYYLMSPYNLFLLFVGDNLTLGIFLITILKIASASITMVIFLYDRNHSYFVVPFAVSYAFMSYAIIYSSNIMWLDGVIALPLVMLGLQYMLEKKQSSVLYMLALCYCLISNFYIGYMICIMSVLFWIYWQICFCHDKKLFFTDMVRFAWNSIIGAGIGAALLLPFALAMGGTKSEIHLQSLFTLEQLHSIMDCLEKWYLGSWMTGDVGNGAPIVYCGTAVLILAAVYFVNRKISVRKKIGAAFILGCFAISAIFKSADLVWHVFNTPNCYPGRYAFLISFFVLVIAYDCFLTFGKREMLAAGLFSIIYLLFAMVFRSDAHIEIKNIMVITCISLVILFAWSIFKDKKAMHILFLILICIDGIWQGNIEMKQIPYENVSEFQNYYKEVNPALEQIKQENNGFYRIEKDFLRGNGEQVYNDSYLFNYNGISCFSSTTKDELKSLMGTLGYRQNYLKIVYGQGSTQFADSFLGIKYLLSREQHPELMKNTKSGTIDVFENVDALGIVTQDLPESAFMKELGQEDTFSYQNQLFSALTGTKDPLLKKIQEVQSTYENMYEENGIIHKINQEEAGTITYEITVPESGYVYYRLNGTVGISDVYINGELLREYYAQSQWNLGKIFANEAGEQLTISVKVDPGECNLNVLEFYQQDDTLYQKEMEKLQKKEAVVTLNGSSELSFDALSSKEGNWTLLSIPYDNNWQCYVDGKKISIQKVYDGFIGIILDKGDHHIEMQYPVKGQKTGLFISGICIGLFFLTIRYKHKK